jgi:hypothetical protein
VVAGSVTAGAVSDEDQIAGIVRRLDRSLRGAISVGDIEDHVRACFGQWEDARVRDYLPIFVERCARERLGAVADLRPTIDERLASSA